MMDVDLVAGEMPTSVAAFVAKSSVFMFVLFLGDCELVNSCFGRTPRRRHNQKYQTNY